MTDFKAPKETVTNEEAIRVLSEAASEKAVSASTGACVYNAGSKTYCAVLTKAQCSQLKGSWYQGKKCP